MHEVANNTKYLGGFGGADGVEKDAHADTWGAGAVEQGRFRRTYT